MALRGVRVRIPAARPLAEQRLARAAVAVRALAVLSALPVLQTAGRVAMAVAVRLTLAAHLDSRAVAPVAPTMAVRCWPAATAVAAVLVGPAADLAAAVAAAVAAVVVVVVLVVVEPVVRPVLAAVVAETPVRAEPVGQVPPVRLAARAELVVELSGSPPVASSTSAPVRCSLRVELAERLRLLQVVVQAVPVAAVARGVAPVPCKTPAAMAVAAVLVPRVELAAAAVRAAAAAAVLAAQSC